MCRCVSLFSRPHLVSKLWRCEATTLLLLLPACRGRGQIFLDWISENFQTDEKTIWVFLQTNDSDTGIWRAKQPNRRSQWTRGLRHRPAASRMLRLWVRIPSGAWLSICFECCVFSGRGLCNKLIIRPEKSYWIWCVVVCDLETSWMRGSWSNGGCWTKKQ